MTRKTFRVNVRPAYLAPISEDVNGPNRISWFLSRLTDHWLAPNMRCDVRLPTPADDRVRYAITFTPGSILVRSATLINHVVNQQHFESPSGKEPLEFWYERFQALSDYLSRGYGFPTDTVWTGSFGKISYETLEETYRTAGNVSLLFGQRVLVVESWPGDQRLSRPKVISARHNLIWNGARLEGMWEDDQTLHGVASRLACPWPLTGKEP